VASRTALWLSGSALFIGLVGDQLLRPVPWGAGTALWLVLAVAAALGFARATKHTDFGTLAAILLTAAFFAACLAWRDAAELKGWNVLAVCAALTLGLLQLRNLRLRAAGLVDYVAESVGAGLRTIAGPVVLLTNDLFDRETPEPTARRRALAIALGIFFAIPVIVLFGALLTSADPVFDRMTRFLFDWDLERLLSHLVVIGFLSWIAAGYLRSVLVRPSETPQPLVQVRRPMLGALEIGIPLGALTVLFLAFIVVQARYLFGGDDLISSTVGLTYAEYARRGFFELVTVAGLVLPLLMVAEWALNSEDRPATRIWRTLAAAILVLVGLIIASAAVRLRLYYHAYGLTQDRLYAAAVMAWIAAALAWFGATVLRGERHRFVFGAIVAGFVVVGGMNVLNPDAVIARANLAREARGDELDARYLGQLSADAAPVLTAALSSLSADQRCTIARDLAQQHAERQGSDWRSWSLGRSHAEGAFETINSALRACPVEELEGADTAPTPGT
jgi:hypothetical protein